MQVFSSFGFVHKIATFEKMDRFQVYMIKLIHKLSLLCFGFHTSSFCVWSLQALVQFSDVETASSAKNALDGRNIPR